MTQVFSIDAETSSYVDLRARGADAYTRDPRTRCLMLAFHPVGRPEPPILWREGDPVPYAIVGHVANGGLFAGWNVIGFDRGVWSRILVERHGFPSILDDNWRDSMHLAAAANLPRSLDGCGAAVGVRFDNDLKDTNRIRRITDANRTTIPATVGEILDEPWLIEPELVIAVLAAPRSYDPTLVQQVHALNYRFDPHLVVDLRWLAARCVQDVSLEEQVLMRLPPWPDVDPWIHMPAIDRKINDRGVLVDVKLVEGMANAAATELRRLNGEMARVTNGQVDSTTKVEDIKRWLLGRGIDLPRKHVKADDEDDADDDEAETKAEKGSPWRLRKNDIANLLSLDIADDCREVLFMRLEAGKVASISKLRSALRSMDDTGRLRQMLLLMGAQANGRFSSKLVQVHNLVRDAFAKDYENIATQNGLDPKGDKAAVRQIALRSLATAIDVGRTGDADLVRMVYQERRRDLQGRWRVESVMSWVSRMMRRVIAAPDGSVFLLGDFANIQARIPVWLAAQQDAVDAFARGEDMYRKQASPVYGKPPEALTSEERQIGKVMRLFLGFGAGANAFIPAAMNYGISIPREDAVNYVNIFRQTNQPMVDYWDANLRCAVNAVTYPGQWFEVPPTGLIAWVMQDDCLFCRLPSGRFLRYWQPRLEQGHWADGTPKQFLDLTVLFVKGRMVFRRTLWRGLAFQNVVSAIEVELLCTSLVNMDRRNVPVVLHVHDSVAAEVREDRVDATMPLFREAMLDMPAWTKGLPVAVDCDWGARFA